MMGRLFQLGSTRASKPSRTVWICSAIWLLMSFHLAHKASHSEQTSVDRPTELWTLGLSAGCPAHLAEPRTHLDIDTKLARPLLPTELLCRPVPFDYSSVPKLFHQSWKTNKLPSKFETWSTVCREKLPDWEWVLWTNEDNLNLVRKYFPWLEEAYLELPGEIYRADFARYLYMYIFGG